MSSISALLDPDSAFLELSPLAAHEVYPDDLPGAGIVTGIGEYSCSVRNRSYPAGLTAASTRASSFP